MIVRTCYTTEEILETGKYTLITFGSEGYAVENDDYVSATVAKPYYKFYKNKYQRCYADPEPLNMFLRMQKTAEWF